MAGSSSDHRYTRSRRLSGPPLSSSNPNYLSSSCRSDIQITENDRYIIFKSLTAADSTSVDMDELREESLVDKDRVFVIFMHRHRCYDLIPVSSKLLVFDHELNVKKAFFALVYNGLRAAPLWDSTIQQFVGMLTITDFIEILHTHYKSSMVPMEELESQKISTWRSELSRNKKPFIWISPEATLKEATRLLLTSKVHRLPVVEPSSGNVLFILTHKRLLKFLYLHLHQLPLPVWLDTKLEKLKIGCLTDVQTIRESTLLVEVLRLFMTYRVSALPIVNNENQLTNIYSRFDVINLAANKTYDNLEITVQQALIYRRERFEGVSTCYMSDTLRTVIERIVCAEVHRLVIIDTDRHVIGIVSLSDILRALVLDHDNPQEHHSSDSSNVFMTTEPMDMS